MEATERERRVENREGIGREKLEKGRRGRERTVEGGEEGKTREERGQWREGSGERGGRDKDRRKEMIILKEKKFQKKTVKFLQT